MGEFRMPSLGADMTEGTLLEWYIKEGDKVKRGDLVAVVATDKADIEVEIYETGTVAALTASPGEKLPVGAPMAVIAVEGEPAPAVPAAAPAVPAAIPAVPTAAPALPTAAPAVPAAPAAVPTAPAEPPSPAAPAAVAAAAPGRRLRASPMARRMARELGVDLEKLIGTGPGGVIESHDVELAAKAPVPGERAPVPEPVARMRRAIAAAMARSNTEIPHYYLATQIDMSKALRWLEEFNRTRPIEARVLPAALLLRAVALALKQVPELNGFWIDGQPKTAPEVNIGVTVSLRTGGLIIPAIHSAGDKGVEEIMVSLREAISRARGGRLRSSDVTAGTITVTNLGDLGVETVFGVIYPPQVALVGFGKIVERPWAEAGMVGARPVLTATLAGDHRATDGRRGSQFLDHLNRLLQKPEEL